MVGAQILITVHVKFVKSSLVMPTGLCNVFAGIYQHTTVPLYVTCPVTVADTDSRPKSYRYQ